ncbi:hypothetical protein TNCV_5077471 [Trichonephila clavipes]|uniref:Uncharacterized protein n=1 Tax=Trichonephila clavipes TaxID=2585209 RepID=A0A8X6VCN5_TRICX|nr:hypothetical protein TNCV_5077471 [Trichonephila clavipes]
MYIKDHTEHSNGLGYDIRTVTHAMFCFMVSPAVQGQVSHPSTVPEFLRSTSCGMTSGRGHGAIVYCLNSGNEERQTGRHNSKVEPAPH